MATQQITHAHPPLGSMVAITDRGALSHYLAPVDLHLGRYFYAAAHRFHVADDRQRAERQTWQTAAATAVLLLPGEFDAAPPPPPASVCSRWAPPADPVGPEEPTEQW